MHNGESNEKDTRPQYAPIRDMLLKLAESKVDCHIRSIKLLSWSYRLKDTFSLSIRKTWYFGLRC